MVYGLMSVVLNGVMLLNRIGSSINPKRLYADALVG